jgi:hypothetical protein
VELPEQEPAQWAIRDVAGLVLTHFGLADDVAAARAVVA